MYTKYSNFVLPNRKNAPLSALRAGPALSNTVPVTGHRPVTGDPAKRAPAWYGRRECCADVRVAAQPLTVCLTLVSECQLIFSVKGNIQSHESKVSEVLQR